MSLFRRYKEIIGVTQRFAGYCGADCVREDYKMNGITFFVIGLISTFFCLTFYTIYTKISEDWTVMLEALCMAGSVVQGSVKLASSIQCSELYYEMDTTLTRIYEEYEDKSMDYNKVLNSCIQRISKLARFLASTYVLGGIGIISLPFILRFVKGERFLVMQFLWPGINVETDVGYFATLGTHITYFFFGATGNFCGDMFFFIFNLHACLFKDILVLKFGELNEIDGAEDRMDKLIEIFKWHQQLILFMQKSTKSFYWVTFVQVFTSAFGICLTIFMVIEQLWPGAYFYLFYGFVVLYGYCAVGTFIEIMNDKICDAVYTNCLWYKLSVPQQQLIGIMITKTQSPAQMTVGGIMPLSVSSGLQVTKAIYSYMMMLLNFIQ